MLLLDTHVLIWWLTDFKQLGPNATRMIENTELVHFSAASIFEIEIKKQKLYKMPNDIASVFVSQGFAELPISAADAASLELANMPGHDPFDQLMLAQAINRGLKFITADSKILERGFEFVLDARV
jgi:PIN domain nuclease of toxin-antitoxin system